MSGEFPISRDPPEGGTLALYLPYKALLVFPISRDPPEGGTGCTRMAEARGSAATFPISRDPPEGGTGVRLHLPR